METYREQAYIWLSAALFLPLLLWPLLLAGVAPEAYAQVSENWLLSAMVLLLAVVVADSVLAIAADGRSLLSACLWILLVSAMLPFIRHAVWSGWLLAVLFSLHALRSAVPIWQGKEDWWHWPAWVRDGVAALVMFYWMTHWPA